MQVKFDRRRSYEIVRRVLWIAKTVGRLIPYRMWASKGPRAISVGSYTSYFQCEDVSVCRGRSSAFQGLNRLVEVKKYFVGGLPRFGKQCCNIYQLQNLLKLIINPQIWIIGLPFGGSPGMFCSKIFVSILWLVFSNFPQFIFGEHCYHMFLLSICNIIIFLINKHIG